MAYKKKKEVAYQDKTVAKENLPFPIVYYPGFYGSFFGFRKTDKSPIILCSCSFVAVENYIKLRLMSKPGLNIDQTKNFILSSSDFPLELIEDLMKKYVPNNKKIIESLTFENKLCHECNKKVPNYFYCHEMYGGPFRQNFGWYINKQEFEWGIDSHEPLILTESCPQEVLELMEIRPSEYQQMIDELIRKKRDAELFKLRKKYSRQYRKICNIVEDQVRIKFGHKKVGEAWSSETILYYIVKSLFPDLTIEKHYRDDFLSGQELDIFIKEKKLGIEYQGIQHFEPISHWGGEEALKELKKRDKIKKEKCLVAGVSLVYFYYNEDLNDELVLAKLKKYI